jgi:hypothetical protein
MDTTKLSKIDCLKLLADTIKSDGKVECYYRFFRYNHYYNFIDNHYYDSQLYKKHKIKNTAGEERKEFSDINGQKEVKIISKKNIKYFLEDVGLL